ncbi:MAG: hypothetical protein H6649_09520 [Caldilineae bacterium]|nr:hypothetical protein [Caldilineae bacterium]
MSCSRAGSQQIEVGLGAVYLRFRFGDLAGGGGSLQLVQRGLRLLDLGARRGGRGSVRRDEQRIVACLGGCEVVGGFLQLPAFRPAPMSLLPATRS